MRLSGRRLTVRLVVASMVMLAALVNAGLGEAQSFVFRFAPGCSKVTLTLVATGSPSVLSLVGYEDNCGKNPRSPVYGTAVLNRDGGVTLGFTTSVPVSVSGGPDTAVQTNVEWPAGASSGTWNDDDGNSGSFVFDVLDQPSG